MGTYEFKTEEERQRHLAYRREYYKRNRDRIRARDNECARRNRENNPEKVRAYLQKYNARNHKKPEPVTFADNPDRELIQREIENEQRGASFDGTSEI